MAHEIHARKTKDGLRYRLWSNVSDSYLTDEMTEEEMDKYIIKLALCEAIEQHYRDIEHRFQRANDNGTSSLMGGSRDINGPWEKEKNK